ncbi:MAG TPA: DoxX family protein [Acidobacteriota bacterium]|nr:DoxX family protein [Acidobacteriota bacterium]
MIGLGILGLIKRDFGSVWLPVPKSFPAREVSVYLCAFISIVSGVGLLWQRTVAVASRVLFTYLMAWLLLLRVPHIFFSPTIDVTWAACKIAVMAAAAWVLYIWFAPVQNGQRRGIFTHEKSLRIARALYGLALIPFGVAHFMYLKQTVVLVPSWLGSPVFWAYFTGCTFIAAGIAVLIGVFARLATLLSALQIGLFTLIVWMPILVKGPNPYQWHEIIVSWALTAGAWVVADSYRNR